MDLQITLISPHVNKAVGHGVFHRARLLVRVRAIRIPALANVRPKFAKESSNFLGDHTFL
jgi:hypothetical protein